MKNWGKFLVGLIVIATCCMGIVACGSKNSNSNKSAKYNTSYEMENKKEDSGNKSDSKGMDTSDEIEENEKQDTGGNDRKIILREYITIETLNFDEDKDAILSRVDKFGGYIEESQLRGRGVRDEYSRRSARYVFRIPRKNYDSFKSEVAQFAHILHENSTTEDVTFQFYDTEARVNTLKIQEERLLEILKKSGDLKDIIIIEKELQQVRYEIERNTTTLRRLSNLVDYTTITVELEEVFEITEKIKEPEDLGDKIVKVFKNSVDGVKEFFKWLILFIVAFIPYLIIIVPLAIIVYFTYRRVIKKSTKTIEENTDKKSNEKDKKDSD
ncbi:DUF4349 domain-containing protein [Oceanirhabdus sp. W0125-5]|uniref:DUF4349 domain-containing protein n=1 Tax=Oceanirhabdus sp. W0125-5 TaxID=2999116 RepID=UPI0022F3383B|nr:DUF4349 domain-containing protein [Oceanirhabdus sp. W0125-5]WBW97687.1 DUF4349 domain-containing protein [Oceanirhabdus sp. W0125-5]